MPHARRRGVAELKAAPTPCFIVDLLFAAQIRFVGKAGEAAKVKALLNMVMNINTAGLAEGLGLGAALGLDLTLRVT